MSIANQITALTADKTAIENAIVAKGGTLSQNCGFDTFAADIATIQSGHDYLDEYIKGKISEYVFEGTSARSNALTYSSIKVLIVPNLTALPRYFLVSSYMTHIYAPIATTIAEYAFGYTSNLVLAYLPKATTFGFYAFRGYEDPGIFKSIVLPSVTRLPWGCFYDRPGFEKIVLGASSVVTLEDSNVFGGTKFNKSSGTGGVAYVPRNLISSYEGETNWSALRNCTFKPIDTETLSGDGATTAFTLTVTTDEVFFVKIGSDFPEYTYDDTTGTITFTTAPASGTNNITVYYKGVETV